MGCAFSLVRIMDYHRKLAAALIDESPFDRFYKIAIEMKSNNIAKQDAYSIYTAFLQSLDSSQEYGGYESLLEVMDCIVGWCSPEQKIYD